MIRDSTVSLNGVQMRCSGTAWHQNAALDASTCTTALTDNRGDDRETPRTKTEEDRYRTRRGKRSRQRR
eukprot:9530833-Heterocapsa_arctica.AAC.1